MLDIFYDSGTSSLVSRQLEISIALNILLYYRIDRFGDLIRNRDIIQIIYLILILEIAPESSERSMMSP